MKKWIWGIVFTGGALCGAMIAIGVGVYGSREGGAPGGEILLPLLIAAMFYMGYTFREMVEPVRRKKADYTARISYRPNAGTNSAPQARRRRP
ncbi:MAG: hypothetical protein ACK5JF_05285 [Oscillospiraceae bacterium]